MQQEVELFTKLSFAALNRWVNIIEDPIVSGGPNAPSHKHNYFQSKGNTESSSDSFKNCQGNKQRAPSGGETQ